MDYKIINTSLMVKGKNYPEGSTISDSALTKDDLTKLSKYLKPISNNEEVKKIDEPDPVPNGRRSRISK